MNGLFYAPVYDLLKRRWAVHKPIAGVYRRNRLSMKERVMSASRTWILVLAAANLPTIASATNFGDPLPGLTPEQQATFDNGKTAFLKTDAPPDGLGPIFNENACAACHV